MKTKTKFIYSAFAVFAFTWLSLSPTTQAVVPPPDGGYPNFTTAKGKMLFLVSPPALQTQQSAGSRSRATRTVASIPVSELAHSFSAPETKIRPLARRRFCSTPPAKTTQRSERPPF
jgi:hypothetical protein